MVIDRFQNMIIDRKHIAIDLIRELSEDNEIPADVAEDLVYKIQDHRPRERLNDISDKALMIRMITQWMQNEGIEFIHELYGFLYAKDVVAGPVWYTRDDLEDHDFDATAWTAADSEEATRVTEQHMIEVCLDIADGFTNQ